MKRIAVKSGVRYWSKYPSDGGFAWWLYTGNATDLEILESLSAPYGFGFGSGKYWLDRPYWKRTKTRVLVKQRFGTDN